MEIEVNLFAFLRRYLPKESNGSTCKMQLNEPMSITDVLKELGIPDEVTQTTIIFTVNGVQAERSQILSDGDALSVVPVASGG